MFGEMDCFHQQFRVSRENFCGLRSVCTDKVVHGQRKPPTVHSTDIAPTNSRIVSGHRHERINAAFGLAPFHTWLNG